jgi:hypothetical protein
MRISLYSGSTLYPLAGESGVSERVHSSAGDFQLTPESAVQVAAFVRGEYAKPIDRGNLLNVLSFSTSRLFDTVAEAQLWCLDYHSGFPSSGSLYFDAIAPNGSITRRVMADAVVNPPQRRVIGATALLDYTVQGGEITGANAGDLLIGGTITPDITGILVRIADINSKPAWSSDGTTSGVLCRFLGTQWFLTNVGGTAAWFSSSTDAATPDIAPGWGPGTGATGVPTFEIL